ncbi:MAG: FAD-linked oxidase C-terminal domain-containing protein [Roseovarius sp.]
MALRGSFSADHGIWQEKRSGMARHKDPGTVFAMRASKTALDPNGIYNPEKAPADCPFRPAS